MIFDKVSNEKYEIVPDAKSQTMLSLRFQVKTNSMVSFHSGSFSQAYLYLMVHTSKRKRHHCLKKTEFLKEGVGYKTNKLGYKHSSVMKSALD